MEISEQLRCLFSAQVERRDGRYVIEIPEREIRVGDVREGETYRVAILPAAASAASSSSSSSGSPASSPSGTGDDRSEPTSRRERGPPEPPVEEGETRDVEIEDIGEQGDGITRVERGFVVIVPDTRQGERVTIEITDVRDNVAFAEVIDRLDDR